MSSLKRVISQIFIGKKKRVSFDPNRPGIPVVISVSVEWIEEYGISLNHNRNSNSNKTKEEDGATMII